MPVFEVLTDNFCFYIAFSIQLEINFAYTCFTQTVTDK